MFFWPSSRPTKLPDGPAGRHRAPRDLVEGVVHTVGQEVEPCRLDAVLGGQEDRPEPG